MSDPAEVRVMKVEQEQRRGILSRARDLHQLSGAFEATGNTYMAEKLWEVATELTRRARVLDSMEGLRTAIALDPHKYGSTETDAAINECIASVTRELS